MGIVLPHVLFEPGVGTKRNWHERVLALAGAAEGLRGERDGTASSDPDAVEIRPEPTREQGEQ